MSATTVRADRNLVDRVHLLVIQQIDEVITKQDAINRALTQFCEMLEAADERSGK